MTPSQPPRTLGLSTATLLVVASMIGTGVFTSSGLLLGELHSAPSTLTAWCVGGLLALTGALSYAELVAAIPQSGGEYHLLSTIFHPSIGFASGLVSVIVGFSAPLAASALAFGSYLHAVWPELPELGCALALLIVMSVVHAGRVGASRKVQDALTGFKLLLIVALAGAGIGAIEPDRLRYATASWLDATTSPAFAVALIYVTFSYSGWNAATYLAGELKDPARTLPRALIGGTAIVTGLYVLLNVVFLGSAPADALEGRVEIAHIAAEHLFGAGAATAISVIIAVGLVSTVGALIMTGTRVLEAMGRDYPILAPLSRRKDGSGPWVAVGSQAALAIALVLTSTFEVLLGYIGFTLSVFAALTVLGVFVLRRTRPSLPRPYRTWGYPLTPLVFVGLMAWMIVWSFREAPGVGIAGAATIGGALALYLVQKALRRAE